MPESPISPGPKSCRDRLIAFTTKIEIRTLITMILDSTSDLPVASTTLLDKSGCAGIMKVKKNHHS